MPESPLSFISTESFRNRLITKNLPPYNVPGFYAPYAGQTTYEVQQSNSNVIDSPGDLINNDPFAQQLYPLNQYGPNGGYNLQITYNQLSQPVDSNQGEYDPNDTKLDIVNEFFIDVAATTNMYLPEGGYNDMVVIDDVETGGKLYLPYWEPPSFRPSRYTPYEILTSSNPTGDNGSLTNDSFLAKIGAQNLKKAFQERVDAEMYLNTVGIFNLNPLLDPFEASLVATGQQPIINKNWRISVPENPIIAGFDFLTRLTGSYWPVSFIPGDYFNENELNAGASPQTQNALNVINQLTGGFLGPILNKSRNPSEIFLANTGNGQKSALFSNLDYNRYKPGYNKNYGGLLGVAQAIVNLAINLINPNNDTLNSDYYVGSKNADPSTITSPPNQVPVNPFGKQVQSPVYGPSELGILFEGNENRINFGLAGKTHTDGGGIDGQFVWTSPKYKGAAGYKATPGGGKGSLDEEFNQISSSYSKNESTNIEFKSSSILDQTQRLIESADGVAGASRLKHVGNAINQVSKVFNDGYKEMTKGSQVVSYKDFTTGDEKGIEYCRVFTKDTPYYTYADLQKTDGITTSGRRFTNSVLDNTFNLNIAPLRNPGSTNIQPNEKGDLVAKKYMFSIENLAWRTSSRPGFTYDDLPVCEKGPNGGRVMWFPPYDLTFNDSSTANWASNDFMGRPEPIYTYKNTTRTGSISWKIIVDSPSVMNIIVEKQLKGKNREKINSVLDSFFAGCVKYDIYELGKKFNKIPSKDLFTYQEILNNPQLTPEELRAVVQEIPKDNTGGNTGSGQADVNKNDKAQEVDTSLDAFKNKYKELGFYFENDIPGKNPNETANEDFESTYNSYVDSANIDKYKTRAGSAFDETGTYCKSNPDFCTKAKNVEEFFTNIVKSNYKLIAEDTSNFIVDAFNILKEKKGTIKISMVGSASATASVTYNKLLSKRRLDSVKKFLKSKTIGDANLSKFFDDKTIDIVLEEGNGEEESIPVGELGAGFSVNCTEDVKSANGKVTPDSQVYSVNAMSCRRVRIKEITVIPIVKKQETGQADVQTTVSTEIKTQTITPKKPKPEVKVLQKEKEGISKIVLRKLLTECDYFDVIKEEVPFLYDSMKEKIRYFNPAFHSMTPEGLNARLTFLNQCVRPGETIPVIGTDGKPKYNDALNTSFGAPPVLILRIGDFYHTKIIPNNLSFSYDPLVLDMNPEGIGVQPMIVKVTLSFNMIGGHGLARPVEQLQNALSFNYYGNTEIYDERAVWTEDTSKLDKEILQSIVSGEKPAETKDVENKPQNNGGDTIGEVVTNIPVTNGQTGEIAYLKIMDKLSDNTKGYMETVLNTMEKVVLQTNLGILRLVSDKRNYTDGTTSINGGTEELKLYGKPSDEDKRFITLFNKVIEDISTDQNPIMDELLIKRGYEFTPSVVRDLKQNMINYINSLKGTIETSVATIMQELTNYQQDYVQVLRKCNLIDSKTDGKILDTGEPRIYTISETDKISESSKVPNKTPLNSYQEFYFDYSTISPTIKQYNNDILVGKSIVLEDGYNGGDFLPADINNISGLSNKLFFMVISRIFNDKNKLDDFKNKIISGNLLTVKSPVNLKNKFNDVVNDIAKKYKKEISDEEKLFKNVRKSKEYKDLVDGIIDKTYPKGKFRKFNYTTVPNQATVQQQTDNVKNLYKTENPNGNGDKKTWTDKVKFL